MKTPHQLNSRMVTAFGAAFLAMGLNASLHADETATALDILNAVGEFHAKQDSIAYELELEFVESMDTNVTRHHSTGSFSFARPNIFHGAVEQETSKTIFISDGEQIFATGPRSRGLYALEAAPATLDTIFTGESLPLGLLFSNVELLWNNLLTSDPTGALMRESESVTLGEGTETHHKVIIETESMEFSIMVPREGDPIISTAIIDLSKNARSQLARRIGEDAAARANLSVVGTYTLDWKFGSEAAPDEAALVIPPGPDFRQARTTLGGLGYMSERAPAFDLIGKPARTVSLPSLTSGQDVDIPHKDTPSVTVLQFWASWCAPCIRSMPSINELAQEFGDQDVKFYAVNNGEPAKSVESYMEKNEYDGLDFITDERRVAAEAFGVMGIPQISIVDSKGVVRHVYSGFSPLMKEIIRNDVKKLIAEKSGQ
ncbi:MAG: redoxin domain-containing protein [Candidatus Sumerlaeia bacterium]|nr:redoxin domain-containing protein [Candidatus Sumerlaeia bacterium]